MKNLFSTKMREENIGIMRGEQIGCSENMDADIGGGYHGCRGMCTDTCDRSCHNFCGDLVFKN